MNLTEKAGKLLDEFKGGAYLYGAGVLDKVGARAAGLGKKPLLIADRFPGSDAFIEEIISSLKAAGLTEVPIEAGAGPNCPLEDLARIADRVKAYDPDVIISFGGGSTIDAAKAAEVLRTLGGEIEEYFGTGLVAEALKKSGKSLKPHIAIQTAASSGAHLTKYSNITNLATGQKKLIVDESIVPSDPVFDYRVTYGAPQALTADGALDGIAHSLEVYYGASGKEYFDRVEEIAAVCIGLVVDALPRVINDPADTKARDAICLATDLGGYAIMVGGTNGGHLTSFSLVDVMPHGRACALMNPYYSVFFAPAIEKQLKVVGEIFASRGFIKDDINSLKDRELGMAVAKGMLNFQESIGYPIRLDEVEGFTEKHISRALEAAKNPQLKMKLQNMPIPMDASMIDTYMGPILEAARTGDLSLIKTA